MHSLILRVYTMRSDSAEVKKYCWHSQNLHKSKNRSAFSIVLCNSLPSWDVFAHFNMLEMSNVALFVCHFDSKVSGKCLWLALRFILLHFWVFLHDCHLEFFKICFGNYSWNHDIYFFIFCWSAGWRCSVDLTLLSKIKRVTRSSRCVGTICLKSGCGQLFKLLRNTQWRLQSRNVVKNEDIARNISLFIFFFYLSPVFTTSFCSLSCIVS